MNVRANSQKPTTGDPFFTRGPKLFHKGIAWMTKGRREKKTLATHQGSFDTARTIVEADWKEGVITQDWGNYQRWMEDRAYEWCIMTRTIPLTKTEKQLFRKFCQEMIGWKYSKWEIGLQALDGIIAKIRKKPKTGIDAMIFRKLGGFWREGVICSGTSNRPLTKLGMIPDELIYGAPDDTWDYMLRSEEWKIRDCTENWDNLKGVE